MFEIESTKRSIDFLNHLKTDLDLARTSIYRGKVTSTFTPGQSATLTKRIRGPSRQSKPSYNALSTNIIYINTRTKQDTVIPDLPLRPKLFLRHETIRREAHHITHAPYMIGRQLQLKQLFWLGEPPRLHTTRFLRSNRCRITRIFYLSSQLKDFVLDTTF